MGKKYGKKNRIGNGWGMKDEQTGRESAAQQDAANSAS